MRSGWLAMNGRTSSRSNASSTRCTCSTGHPFIESYWQGAGWLAVSGVADNYSAFRIPGPWRRITSLIR
jgi:hypothetical protein